MPHRAPFDFPPLIGLLPDSAVAKYLSRGMQSGRENPPQVALRKASTILSEDGARWRTAPIRELLDQAMTRFDGEHTAADRWLAPRLHATLRMTRSEAGDSRLWNHLSMLVAPDYVVWRHKGAEIAQSSRFSGPHYTQCFSRLWWVAELFRDGPDYRPVEIACSVQDVLNTTLRLDVIDHRPTAQALLRVLENLISTGRPRLGDHVNTLSSAVNTAGSTLVYDVLAPDSAQLVEDLQDWIAEAEGAPPVRWDGLPEGPDDGRVPTASVDALLPLFDKLLAEAPLRRRGRTPEEEADSPTSPAVPAPRRGVSLEKNLPAWMR
ncbi:hypothetical protein SAMN04487983_1004149 [Streptomyces sp. yr375]|uniref:DUF6339 family protein n=1 Tax=Streptomyces sp. yr375 TaxID=1761906 RepID=UPI0008AE1CC4|nr:DUF6339 family protein [Streptomyces sp. yr375]SEQ32203.1 hypothetical protein SAMN04487983_1004149 [Streptomyces sp. yr375]